MFKYKTHEIKLEDVTKKHDLVQQLSRVISNIRVTTEELYGEVTVHNFEYTGPVITITGDGDVHGSVCCIEIIDGHLVFTADYGDDGVVFYSPTLLRNTYFSNVLEKEVRVNEMFSWNEVHVSVPLRDWVA